MNQGGIMNLKMMLGVSLLALVVLGTITYGYLMYSINAETAGTALVTKFKLMVYAELVIQLLQIAVGGLLVYKT